MLIEEKIRLWRDRARAAYAMGWHEAGDIYWHLYDQALKLETLDGNIIFQLMNRPMIPTGPDKASSPKRSRDRISNHPFHLTREGAIPPTPKLDITGYSNDFEDDGHSIMDAQERLVREIEQTGGFDYPWRIKNAKGNDVKQGD